ncbi:MAG: hypothetical protein ACYSU5_14280 [Planctomycetota bacterium]
MHFTEPGDPTMTNCTFAGNPVENGNTGQMRIQMNLASFLDCRNSFFEPAVKFMNIDGSVFLH